MKRQLLKTLWGIVLIALIASHYNVSAQTEQYFKSASLPAVGEAVTTFNFFKDGKRYEIKVLSLNSATDEECLTYINQHHGIFPGNLLKGLLQSRSITGRVLMFSPENFNHPRERWISAAQFTPKEVTYCDVYGTGAWGYDGNEYLLFVTETKID